MRYNHIRELKRIPATLGTGAFESIRRDILVGKLKPGTRIDQQALAQELGTSVVPIREALRRLEAEELVRIIPRRGAFVSPVSRGELVDIYVIREALEGIATRSAAENLTSVELDELARLIANMEQLTEREEYEELLVLNREFHLAIYRASGRQFLCDLITDLWGKAARYRATYVKLPGGSRQALDDHREILQSLQERNVEAAVRAVQNNIRETMTRLLSVFDDSSQDVNATP